MLCWSVHLIYNKIMNLLINCFIYCCCIVMIYNFLWKVLISSLFILCICSISKNSMYNLLQSRLDSLLFEIVFPLMCFNDNDQKLWDEDPHEYVRKGYGMASTYEFIALRTLNCCR